MKEVIINKPKKNIPIHTVIEKKKVLFHDTKKVLFFEKNRNGKTTILLPTFASEYDFRENASFMKQFVNERELVELCQAISYSEFFKCNNNSLIPLYEKQIRTFFAYYHEFTSEEINTILDFCVSEQLKAHMLSFDEIRNLKLRHDFYFDPINISVSNDLEVKIKEYVKR